MHNLEKMPEEGILLPKNPASKTRIFFALTEALEKKEPLFVEGISDSLKSLLALGFRGKWILYLCPLLRLTKVKNPFPSEAKSQKGL